MYKFSTDLPLFKGKVSLRLIFSTEKGKKCTFIYTKRVFEECVSEYNLEFYSEQQLSHKEESEIPKIKKHIEEKYKEELDKLFPDNKKLLQERDEIDLTVSP